MRHFNYFANGGPFPGTCISCGNNKDLYDVGGTRFDGGNNLLCGTCAKELATFIGYEDPTSLEAEVNRLTSANVQLEIEIAKIPNLVDGLINGIRSSVTDFIFAVSYSDSADKPEIVSNIPVSDSGEYKASKAAAGQRKAPSKSVSE